MTLFPIIREVGDGGRFHVVRHLLLGALGSVSWVGSFYAKHDSLRVIVEFIELATAIQPTQSLHDGGQRRNFRPENGARNVHASFDDLGGYHYLVRVRRFQPLSLFKALVGPETRVHEEQVFGVCHAKRRFDDSMNADGTVHGVNDDQRPAGDVSGSLLQNRHHFAMMLHNVCDELGIWLLIFAAKVLVRL